MKNCKLHEPISFNHPMSIEIPLTKNIAYLLERFPSPTEYFILNEIHELEKRGIKINILVLRKQKKYFNIPELKSLKAPIIYLPKIYFFFPFLSFFFAPFLTFSTLIPSVLPLTNSLLKNIRNYFISLYFAHKLKNIHHIHAHFAFIATDIAFVLSKLLHVKFSLTVHAQDIYTNENKIKKLANDASFLITCTKYNEDYLHKIIDINFRIKIYRIYHGIEILKWTHTISRKRFNNSTIHIISIARLVEKKGLIYLLKAIRLLIESGNKVTCSIIGEGPLKKEFEAFIKENRLHNTVQIKDFMPQEEVKKHLTKSDIFILPCIVNKDGDRDGLPNVIIEAMILGIPVISTPVSAIPEVIEDRVSGLLVGEKDEKAITNAIMELKKNTNLYDTIANNSRKKILEKFAIDKCTDELIEVFKKNI